MTPSFASQGHEPASSSPHLRWAWLAIFAALTTMGLKFGAYWLTDSVGLLSDAVESSANLVAALSALFALWFASRPVDRSHNYGHGKVEFFASGLEGALILIAAVAIVWSALGRLVDPRPLESFGAGSALVLAATLINLAVARWLLRVAHRHDSLTLAADGRHLMTDVWTSIGVVAGLGLVQITGNERLDPIIALLVGVNIAWTGAQLLRVAVDGLMDRAIPVADEAKVREAIVASLAPGETYHALRTRRSGEPAVRRLPPAGSRHTNGAPRPPALGRDGAGDRQGATGCRSGRSHRADRGAGRLGRQPAGPSGTQRAAG